VLDCRDRTTLALSDDRAEFGGCDRQMASVDQALTAAWQARAEKNDAVVGLGGMNDDFNVSP
jgi:hypothetical protein